MTTGKTSLQIAHESVGHIVRRMREDGELPKHISLDGCMALLHDKIVRWFQTKDNTEIEGMAANAIFALSKTIPDLDKLVPKVQDMDLLVSEDVVNDE